jgi:hypothetical protein
MSKNNPTPAELDAISNAMLGKPKCDQCGARPGSFTDLVQHLKDAHPGSGSTKSA